jgi:mannose-6-phosphate isomerase
MSQTALYPLQFEPIYQYRLWGGRHLADLLAAPLPGDGPIGEAWVLSDRDDHSSRVGNGSLKGQTIGQVLEQFPEQVMGKFAGRFRRFPLLLKFLDVREMLSVQVHPTDAATAKTEAWVVLEAGIKSRIYAGLKVGSTVADLRRALTNGSVADHLPCFHPKPGDAVLLPAGTVHSLGGGVVVFEVQQNSDVTFRLFDWNHVDPKTGQPRALQVDQDFWLSRVLGESPFTVGATGVPHVLVCIDGKGQLNNAGATYEIGTGDVLLLPAVLGACSFHPHGPVNVLEIEIPE